MSRVNVTSGCVFLHHPLPTTILAGMWMWWCTILDQMEQRNTLRKVEEDTVVWVPTTTDLQCYP